jgi:hypothetical protein
MKINPISPLANDYAKDRSCSMYSSDQTIKGCLKIVRRSTAQLVAMETEKHVRAQGLVPYCTIALE